MFPKNKRLKDEETLKKFRKRHCDVCGKSPTKDNPNHACHIQTKGSGGDDVSSNLYTGCAEHHYEQGTIGWAKMFQKYPFFRQVIYNKGWTLVSGNKLRRE